MFNNLKNSISEQSKADVKTGILFSGGIDSSLISCLSNKSALHLIGASSNIDTKIAGMSADAKYASLITKNYNKNVLELKVGMQKSAFEMVDEVVLGNEELCSDITYLISRDLCLEAKNNGITVLLSGMGADEIFMGYPRYKIFKYCILFSRFKYFLFLIKPFLSALPSMQKADRLLDFLFNNSDIYRYYSILSNFRLSEIDDIVKKDSVSMYIKRSNLSDLSLKLKTIKNLKLMDS